MKTFTAFAASPIDIEAEYIAQTYLNATAVQSQLGKYAMYLYFLCVCVCVIVLLSARLQTQSGDETRRKCSSLQREASAVDH